MPHQLLHRQPAHALDEGALDLAHVHRRVQRRAHVVQHVGPRQLPLAGQRVDDDLAHGRTVREVIERPALQGVAVPVQLRRGVEAVAPQLHARHVGLQREVGEGDALAVDDDLVVGEAHVLRVAAPFPRREGGETVLDLPRRVLRRLAVQVAARRRRGGRGVGDLLRVGGRHAHALEVHAQLVRDDLRHLGVQPLAHLGAAVVHEDRAVVVDVHQRARLVEVLHVERDAELHRREGDALLQYRARRVEGRDLLAACRVVAGRDQLVGQRLDDVVLDLLAIRREVVRLAAVVVGAAHRQRVLAELARDRVEDHLDGDRALRAAEAAERGVALRVGARAVAVDRHVGQPVRVVEVAQRARHHRARQVGAEAGVGHHVDLGAEHAAVVVVADLVAVLEAVAAAGDEEVVVAIEPQLHRAIELLRGNGGHAGRQRRLRLLAAEATAHAPALDVHMVRVQLQRMRHRVLHLSRMLRRAVDLDAVVLQRHRVGDLAFEVELLLAAH